MLSVYDYKKRTIQGYRDSTIISQISSSNYFNPIGVINSSYLDFSNRESSTLLKNKLTSTKDSILFFATKQVDNSFSGRKDTVVALKQTVSLQFNKKKFTGSFERNSTTNISRYFLKIIFLSYEDKAEILEKKQSWFLTEKQRLNEVFTHLN